MVLGVRVEDLDGVVGTGFVWPLGFPSQEVEKAKAKESDKDGKQKEKDTWDV